MTGPFVKGGLLRVWPQWKQAVDSPSSAAPQAEHTASSGPLTSATASRGDLKPVREGPIIVRKMPPWTQSVTAPDTIERRILQRRLSAYGRIVAAFLVSGLLALNYVNILHPSFGLVRIKGVRIPTANPP